MKNPIPFFVSVFPFVLLLASCAGDGESPLTTQTSLSVSHEVSSDYPNKIRLFVEVENADYLYLQINDETGSEIAPRELHYHISADENSTFRDTLAFVWPDEGRVTVHAYAYESEAMLSLAEVEKLRIDKYATAEPEVVTIIAAKAFYQFYFHYYWTYGQEVSASRTETWESAHCTVRTTDPDHITLLFSKMICEYDEHGCFDEGLVLRIPKSLAPGKYQVQGANEHESKVIYVDSEAYVEEQNAFDYSYCILEQNDAQGISGQIESYLSGYGELGQDSDYERRIFNVKLD